MKLQIDRQHVQALISEFPRLAKLQDQLRFGNKADVPFRYLSTSEVNYLQWLYQKDGGLQGQAAQLSTLQQAMNDDTVRFEEDDLEMLLPAIARYLVNNGLRGWLFQANATGKPMAYLVTCLLYTSDAADE